MSNRHTHDDWPRLVAFCDACIRRVADDQRTAELLELGPQEFADEYYGVMAERNDVSGFVHLAAASAALFRHTIGSLERAGALTDERDEFARWVVAVQTGAAA